MTPPESPKPESPPPESPKPESPPPDTPPRQLPLGLPLPVAHGRADFFVSPANARALAMIDRWPDWPQGKLILTGPAGAGKTHLLHLWAERTGAPLHPARALSTCAPDDWAGRSAHLAVEDCDTIARDPRAEAALFHLHNLITAQGGTLILSARTAPARWDVALPDLASRLQAIATVALAEPDDALLQAVLVKLFADRQLTVSPQLIAYLLARMERSLGAARALVDALDRHAIAARRPVTRKLAAEVLDAGPPA